MAVNVSKTKFIIVHTKSRIINDNMHLIYNDNEPGEYDPSLIKHIGRIHTNHTNPSLRSYKLLGIKFNENLTSDDQTQTTITKL